MRRSAAVFLPLLLVAALGCPGGQAPSTDSAEPPHVYAPDGLEIAVTVEGRGAPALVLIHCWACDRSFWSGQVEALAGKYRVVTLDLPGHGESGMERPGWPLERYAEDVQSVVETLDLHEVVLVGHSMGGPVALEAAARMGERVIGVIAVDTLHNVEFKYDPEQFRSFVETAEQDFPAFCDRFVRSMFLADADPALVTDTVNRMCDGAPEVGLALFRQFGDYDHAEAMRAVRVPVRCINGPTYPTEVEINRKYAADFDAVILEGSGHFPMFDQPEEFNELLLQVLGEIAGG